MSAQSKFESQKLAYAKRLTKKAKTVDFSAPAIEKLTAWNNVIHYCEKWVRLFEEESKPRMNALLESAEAKKKSVIEWDEWQGHEAQRRYAQSQETKRTYRELGLVYAP